MAAINICELHQKRSSCIETKGSASPNLTEHEDSRELGMKRSGALSWVTDQVWDSIPKEERKKAWVNTASMRVQGEVLFLTSKHIDCCHQSKEECIRLSQTLQTPCYRMTEFCLFSLESISMKALHLPISAATCLLFLMLFFTPKTHSFIQLATSVSYRTQLLFDHGTHDSFSNLKRLIQPQIQILQLDYTQILFIENSIFILDGTPLIHRIFSIDIEYVAEWGTWEYYFHSRTQRHSTCMFPLSTIILNSDSREGILRSLLKVWWSRQV